MTSETSVSKIVRECLAEYYGIGDCALLRLPGENLNFQVTRADGRRSVFKIVDDDMPPEVVELENAAIEHAASNGFEPRLPRITNNKFGNLETGIKLPMNGPWRARVLDFIEGTTLSDLADISDRLLADIGKALAQFHRVMRGFDHPAACRDHRWNLATAGQHEHVIARLGDADERALLGWAFRGWHSARHRLEHLRWQFVHGDAHDENWLVRGNRVAGLIDFGDCCRNPVVCDLAICLAYLMMRGPDPVVTAAAITDGYQRVQRLGAEEFAVLYPLVCARLAVSVCVANERKAIDPSNPNWFSGEGAAWRLLGRLRSIGPDRFNEGLR